MFTTVMYGFINEVTRQPGTAEIALRPSRGSVRKPSAARPQRKIRARASSAGRQLGSQYRVLADSFKCAAGFH